MKLSIVIPVHNEEKNIKILAEEITTALKNEKYQYEIWFINDYSNDSTWNSIVATHHIYSVVKGINLYYQVGQTGAIAAGISASQGDIIVTLDGDGQNDPKNIPQLLGEIEKGYDVVSGWRVNRKDRLFTKRIPSFIANKIIQKLSGVWVKDLGCGLKAYKKEYISHLRLYGDMHRLLPIYVVWEGAKLQNLVVHHRARKFGKSHYNILRTFRVFLDIFLLSFVKGFRTRPLYYFGFLGIITLLISGATFFGSIIFFTIFKFKVEFIGISILLSVVLFLLALIFVGMGILAENMMRTYYESQDKFAYRIKDKIS